MVFAASKRKPALGGGAGGSRAASGFAAEAVRLSSTHETLTRSATPKMPDADIGLHRGGAGVFAPKPPYDLLKCDARFTASSDPGFAPARARAR